VSSAVAAERWRLRRKTGLTDRQLEFLVGVAAYQRVYGSAPRGCQVTKFLVEHPELALLQPSPVRVRAHHTGYQNASLRLFALGYVRLRAHPNRDTTYAVTPDGWTKLKSLTGNEQEAPDVVGMFLNGANRRRTATCARTA